MSDLIKRVFKRTSMLSGKTRERTYSATQEQWYMLDKGALIQQALPHLTAGDREFIMTGSTDEEWDATFPEDEEDGPGGLARAPDEPAF